MNGKNTGSSGITLVEVIIVIFIVAVLAFALFPLISTTYNSWRIADRRIETLEIGRVGMSKISREIRKAYDLRSCTDPTYIDFYPDWASSTVYRINYDGAENIEFGTQTPVFVNDSLASPVDSFSYTAYSRRMDTGITRHRVVNSFRFRFEVSDERQILPDSTYLNPMEFKTHVQLRTSREGFMLARTTGFASETYYYNVGNAGNPGNLCVKVFCDRVNREIVSTANVVMTCFFCPGFPNSWTWSLSYNDPGDYWAGCIDMVASNVRAGAGFITPSHRLSVTVSDASETCQYAEAVKIDP